MSTKLKTHQTRLIDRCKHVVTLVALTLISMPVAARQDTNSNMAWVMQDSYGAKGWLLRRLGTSGYVVASQNQAVVFEPASAIKFLIHLHAELQIQNGQNAATLLPVSPSALIPWSGETQPGICPDPNAWLLAQEQLETMMSMMMWQSHNPRTAALVHYFREDFINETASQLGGTNTLIQHRHGCGAEALLKPNRWTLNDATLLYQQAFTGSLLTAANRQHLWDRMPNNLQQLKDTAHYEAWTHYGQAPPQTFYDHLKVAFKGGSYTLCGYPCKEYRALAGYVQIPTKGVGVPLSGVAPRKYVFGVFIHGDPRGKWYTDRAFDQGLRELFRTEIRAALDTFF